MSRHGFLSATFGAVMVLGGCSTSWITGLDATNRFACKTPDGVSCVGTSKVFDVVNTTPGGMGQWDPTSPEAKQRVDAVRKGPNAQQPPAVPQGSGSSSSPAPAPPTSSAMQTASVQYTTPGPLPTAAAAAPGGQVRTSPAAMDAPSIGTPLRSPERILRVWVAPFEDADGDLHDQRYVYLTVNRGQWSIEAARKQIREQYQAIRLLSARSSVESEEKSAEPSQAAAAARATLPSAAPAQR